MSDTGAFTKSTRARMFALTLASFALACTPGVMPSTELASGVDAGPDAGEPSPDIPSSPDASSPETASSAPAKDAASSPQPDASDAANPGGCSICPKGCFDLANDPNNCGSCGYVCPAGDGGAPRCEKGQCSIVCNDSGETLCQGACVDTKSDPGNCGVCGRGCGGTGGYPTCVDGLCKIAAWVCRSVPLPPPVDTEYEIETGLGDQNTVVTSCQCEGTSLVGTGSGGRVEKPCRLCERSAWPDVLWVCYE